MIVLRVIFLLLVAIIAAGSAVAFVHGDPLSGLVFAVIIAHFFSFLAE